MNTHAKTAGLFSAYDLSGLPLKNRLVMAPMTRSRAGDDRAPGPLAAEYYAQRASAGLIVTEATHISEQGIGYVRTPGIYSASQVAGWKKVTDAVHAAGGKIFLQLWHVGRISHADFHGGEAPVAPSAIAAEGQTWTPAGQKPFSTPRALDAAELPGIVEDFRRGAENAKAAGFDGVEVHGANGYLLDQFTREGSNRRTDDYGGSLANRLRFPLEVTDAVIGVWGANRVGYRISPYAGVHSMSDADPLATFSQLTDELSARDIAYLHVVDAAAAPQRISPALREIFRNTYIVAEGFDAGTAQTALASGETDLVAFGKPFLANPDLPLRFKQGAALNAPDIATFYQGEAKGYTDYPALA